MIPIPSRLYNTVPTRTIRRKACIWAMNIGVLLLFVQGCFLIPKKRSQSKSYKEVTITDPNKENSLIAASIINIKSPVDGAIVYSDEVYVMWTVSDEIGLVDEIRIEIHPKGQRRPVYIWTSNANEGAHMVGDRDSGGELQWFRSASEEGSILRSGVYELRILVASRSRVVSATREFAVNAKKQ